MKPDDPLVKNVKRNCDIADAKSWGSYSVCGLLMRLRELYYSEHDLRPWQKVERASISEWIGGKEALWHELAGESFARIETGKSIAAGDPANIPDDIGFDPFDAPGVNKALAGRGLVYGAGYGPNLRATFFLAEVIECEGMDSLEIYICGRERARDLSSAAAMLLGDSIFARLEANENLIWQKFEEFRAKPSGLLRAAFSAYGTDPENGKAPKGARAEEPETIKLITAVSKEELRTYIRHELGEAAERKRLGPVWSEVLIGIENAKHAMFLRSVKDVLADTCPEGMLRYIIEEKKTGSLAFYAAFLSGYRKLLSSNIEEAILLFFKNGSRRSWAQVEKAVNETYIKTRAISSSIVHIHSRDLSLSQFIENTIKNL